MEPHTFTHADFKNADGFSEHDKYNALPTLARFVWNLTDCEANDRDSRRIAIDLAKHYLRSIRVSVAACEASKAVANG